MTYRELAAGIARGAKRSAQLKLSAPWATPLKASSYCSFLAVAGCLLQGQPLTAAEGVNGNLVTVTWLARHLKDADVRILDASPTQTYAAQHIPGAVSADLLSYGVKETPAADTERLYRSWGISHGNKVVLYDQGGTFLATRLFFSLYYHGFPPKNLLVLDGGLPKWQERGLPVTTDLTPSPRNGSLKLTRFREDARVRLPEFLAASGDPVNNALLEALGANWHFGGVLAFERAGHVPHAILLPSGDFYNPDKTFKSPDELRRMLTYFGVRPEQRIYAHCGGGVAASVPFFALKFILDYPNVKLYTESQMGWMSDERQLPYWTYDAPSLMRTTNWLQFWGGQRIRAYGSTNVSIVDVRPAAAFSQGHLPFALNVPAEAFKSNIGKPERLSELLGPAGVEVSQEAVVISGAGLTKDSALAFVMLEKLGQRKVSVFMDSIDRWAELGFPVTKDETVVGPKKLPQDLAIPPTAYPTKFREQVIIADPKSTQGLYPKVFIASGENVPAQAQDGKVVHLPYTELLNANGTPKAAKDIWSILTKAGVPRYAELICFSDDPGEAAANYFVLKLMGYPDIKVLVI